MKVLTGAFTALAASTALADDIAPSNVFFTGNDIYGFCQRGDPFRLGYVAGLWDLNISRCIRSGWLPHWPKPNAQRRGQILAEEARLVLSTGPRHSSAGCRRVL
jgi:hypothetical protein